MAVDSADAAIPAVLEPMPPPLVNEEGFAFYTPARHSAPTATMNAAADAIVDISAELAERRTRWRYLAEKADWLLGSTSHARDDAAAARKCQPQDPAVDRYEAASYYIKDAMHGRKIIAHIHTQRQLSAVRLARARPIILIFNVLCFFQLLLPLIEMPMGWECREGAVRSIQNGGVLCELDGDSLAWFVGWRPTMLGSSWLELPICAFFLFEIALLFMIRDRCSGRPFYHTNVWATMRLACVWLQLVDILIFLWGRYTYEGTALSMEFFRYSRALTFFIYITNHQYLRLFVKGLWHVLPRLMPVATAAAFVVCLYGYVGYLAFNHTRAQPDALRELDLFRTLPGAMLTALRMFTSVVFVLDLEFLYRRSPGIRIYCATYALLAAVLLCALVTAVANKLFQQQSLDAYRLVIRQRARALSMAFDCLRGANIGSSDGSSGGGGGGAAEDGGGKSPVPNGGGKGGGGGIGHARGGTGHARGGSGSSGVPAVVGGAEVTADDWVALMAHLRPDLSGRGCRLLFNTVGEGCGGGGGGGGDSGPTRCDRAQFFELCALVQAHIEGGAEDWRAPLRGSASSMPQPRRRNSGGGGGSAEGGCCAALAHRCGSTVRALRRRVRRYVRWTVATPFNNWWGLTHADDIHVRRAVNNVASVVHAVLLAVQGTVLPGEQDPAGNTAFEGRELHMALLEYTLVVYFWADAAAVLWAGGGARALSDAYWCLGVALNAVATAWVAGAWPEGRDRAYYVAMAPRALGLWRVVHQLQGTRSDVAERLARVLPTLLRSTSVLLAFVYSSALCAYGMLWHTPLGVQDTTAVSANPMMKRWMAYSEVVGYESFGDSLLSMLDTLLLGNWTLFMDAAFVAIGWPAWWFFYLFKVLTLYFIQPVLLGFVVQAWMGARVPAAAAPSPPYAPPSPCSSASDDGYSSDDDDRATGLLSHAADCGAGGGGGGDSYAAGDSVGGAMVAAHARRRGSSAGGGGGSSDVVHLAPVPRTLSNFWGPQEAAARESMELQELHEHVDTLEIELAAAKEAAQRLRQQLAISLMRSAFSHRPVTAGLPRHQSTDSVTGSNGSFNSVGGISGGNGGGGGGDPARRLLRRSTGNYGSTQ